MSSNSDGEFAGTSPDRDINDAHGHVRIGAIEREAALAALGQHFREGRLTVDEYSTRCAAVVAAVIRSDLKPVFIDLPVSTADFTVPDVDESLRRHRAQFAAQRLAQERKKNRTNYLATLFRRLRVTTTIAAFVALVLAFYSLFYGSENAGWVIAIVVFACGAIVFAGLAAHFEKKR